LADLRLGGVRERGPDGGDEGRRGRLRGGRGVQQGARHGDAAVGEGVLRAAPAAVFLGGAAAFFAPVAETGEGGAADHEEG
jgi:hypothetical protein